MVPHQAHSILPRRGGLPREFSDTGRPGVVGSEGLALRSPRWPMKVPPLGVSPSDAGAPGRMGVEWRGPSSSSGLVGWNSNGWTVVRLVRPSVGEGCGGPVHRSLCGTRSRRWTGRARHALGRRGHERRSSRPRRGPGRRRAGTTDRSTTCAQTPWLGLVTGSGEAWPGTGDTWGRFPERER